MKALHEYGLIGCYADYLDLPIGMILDARLLMEARAMGERIEANRG